MDPSRSVGASPPRKGRGWGWVSLASFALLALLVAFRGRVVVKRSIRRTVAAAKHRLYHERPGVAWETARPEKEGLSSAVLDSLCRVLAANGTHAFLVVRGNHIVFEWYSTKSGPNVPELTTAMAKAATANIALLTAITDGRISLDDSASKYIPGWRNDTLRSRIRIGDLAAHQSGLDDVDFGLAGKGGLPDWKEQYFHHPDQRFAMAIGTVPLIHAPGARSSYSGVGYYALAYALTTSLKPATQHDIKTLLRERIMHPLGIQDDNWRLSYGASYQVDGMTLYAMGSGAAYTARAVARIGELMLDHGRFGSQQLIDSAVITKALQPATAPIPEDSSTYPVTPAAAGGGWWLNIRGAWPDVPRDAFAGMGGQQEALLVVPSLDLVMVRLGAEMVPGDDQFAQAFRDRLFDPLMHAVIGASSRMRQSSSAH